MTAPEDHSVSTDGDSSDQVRRGSGHAPDPVLTSTIEAVLRSLRDDDGPSIVVIGDLLPGRLDHWPDHITQQVIVTRERRQHYLERHPEMVDLEVHMIRALLDPAEIHSNKQDRQVAIFYASMDDGGFLRVPIWISDRGDRQNSVLSLRRARVREVEAGRKAGRRVWTRT